MLTGWRLTLSKMFIIPQRYVLGIMGFFAVLNAYTMRTSLSVAITEMVLPSNSSEVDPNACPADSSNSSSNSVTDINKLYDWDETTQGLILSSFYYGYVLTHIPGGVLAEKFGGKYTLSLGILSTSIFTLLIPVVIQATNGNWVWVLILRICVGFGEGTTFPALNAMLSQWVPATERSKIGTMVYAGSQMGTIVGNLISGLLISATQDWASVFYFFGFLGILWFILFSLLCYSTPESHPFISDSEKKFLSKEMDSVSKEKRVIPWRYLLTSFPVWALVFSQIGHDWGFFAMVTDLPKYMKEVLKFNVKQNGMWSSLPYLVMWCVSMSSAWLCDWLIKTGYMRRTFARKFFTSIASIGPGIFIVAASYSGCDRMLAVGMFTIAMGLMGTFYCGMKCNGLDLCPNYAGSLMAIVNGVGAISGIITPYLISALTQDHTLTQWRLVFWITLGVLVATNMVFVIFASGEVQWWNDPQRVKDAKNAIEDGKTKENNKSPKK